ncbi:hypothetical protein ACNAW0_21485 [Micromonospora sp. SL1-18]|uniref:hypothetical protein n=1 Tax=Micromonospora sp. SL1-18 TaxID=3399128 RepID=UPI003A4E0B7C
MTTEYSGTGDPARSLALSWRTRDKPSRKGADLTVERIEFGLARVLDDIEVLVRQRSAD